jgi:hypothetical protein
MYELKTGSKVIFQGSNFDCLNFLIGLGVKLVSEAEYYNYKIALKA